MSFVSGKSSDTNNISYTYKFLTHQLSKGLSVACRGFVTALFIFLFLLSFQTSSATTITVNTMSDVIGNDGVCSLREAVIAANTNTASGGMTGIRRHCNARVH